MSIAGKENIGGAELDAIPGTGTGGRVRKQDVLKYLETRKTTLAITTGAD